MRINIDIGFGIGFVMGIATALLMSFILQQGDETKQDLEINRLKIQVKSMQLDSLNREYYYKRTLQEMQ